ncbi:MAG TPA: STAS/SEC14 domain-containing protein, partial [Allosphingosinicella sp.]
AVMDRLDGAMARNGKVHVFVETQTIDGIELSSLPSYMARAMPLFGKLTRFGRVAVVADQAWVRLGTRIESAVLPFISYRTFMPEQRGEALAWVEGRGAGQ